MSSKATLTLPGLKRIPSFNLSRGNSGLFNVDPVLRFSLTKLGEANRFPNQDLPSPATEARFVTGWHNKFRDEWGRLRSAVRDLFRWSKKQPSSLPNGYLTILHNDVHVLLRSQAGAFIFEHYQNTLLPEAIDLLFEDITCGNSDIVMNLSAAWTNFYCNTIPEVEAIFISVKNHRTSIRQTTLVAFRNSVVLKLESQLVSLLEDMFENNKVPPSIKQMFLVLQNITECYPPSDEKLQLESMVARVISPYFGYRGLYEGGYPNPILISRELEVAHLRRPSLVDPRRLQRPLSTTSSRHIETLSDLFAISASRHRTWNRETYV